MLFIRHTDRPDPAYTVVVLHGFGEHGERYGHILRYFHNAGAAVVIGDLPGHGRSPGMRGDIAGFSEYLAAGGDFMRHARAEYGPSVPLVLLGHSMGGLIAALLAARETNPAPDALVLSSPSFGLAVNPPAWKTGVGRLLAPVFPRITQPAGLRPGDLTHDAEIAKAYAEDPLVARRVTLRFYFAFRRAMEEALQSASKVRVPTFVAAAGEDRIASAAAARKWFDLCGSPLKTYREYPGLYHEIFNEEARWEILDEISGWIGGLRLDRAGPSGTAEN